MAWTKIETQFLLKHYADQGLQWCCNELSKSAGSVRNKAWRLGLRQNHDSKFFKDWQSRAAKSKVGKKRPQQALVIKRLYAEGKLNFTTSRRKESSKRQKDMKMLKTKIRNGTYVMPRNNSSWKAGWRTIGGIKKYYRSRWEANYARYLEWLKQKGEIADWKHEPTTFWFENIKRGVRSYLPDFLVTENNGKQVYHEVKGWMDPKSKTKLKRMAKYYPDIPILLIDKSAYTALKKVLAGLISDWE